MINHWDPVYEQNKAITQLNKIITSRRVPHAFIFCGKDGVGKFNIAIQFTKALVYSVYPQISPSDLEKYDQLQEPNIKLIFPLPRGKNEGNEDSAYEKLSKETIEEIKEEIKKKSLNHFHKISIEKANTIKISSIRDIKKFVSFSGNETMPYRFVIILEAELMNEQSQNALLKNLEEPPEGIIFIIITSNVEQLLLTIISRCNIVNFDPLSFEIVKEILVNKFEVDEKTAKKVSKFADGSVTEAIKVISYDFESIQEKTINILRHSFASKYQVAITEISEFAKNHSNESVLFLIKMIKIWINDVVRFNSGEQDISFENHRDTIKKFIKKYPNADFSKTYRNLEYLETCFDRNLNLNVLFTNLIFELASVVKRN